jgi:hypothetical protein
MQNQITATKMFQLMTFYTKTPQALARSVCEHISTKWFEDIFYVIARMEQEVLRQSIGATKAACKHHYTIL